jgi:ABC-type transport system involved in multi-copper enzyme maturation permease subunit
MGFLTAARRVFDLSLGEMLWSRRTIFMALVVAGPIVLALIMRGVELFGMSALRVNGRPVPGFGIFGVLIWSLYLFFIVPVLGVFYGTALMADEVEDKTITYLFTRPVSRGAVLVGKYLAYVVCTVLVVLPSVMIVYFLLVPFSQLPTTFGNLVIDLGLLALALAVYGAVFAFVGAFFKRPLLIGLVYVFGFQLLALSLPGSLKQFAVAFYVNALVPHAMPADGVSNLLQSMFRENPPLWVCLFWLFAILTGFLYLATRVVERKEYVLEQ